MLLKDKIAIVTGASQGIGEAIARKFSEHGAIIILCSRNVDKLKIVSFRFLYEASIQFRLDFK